MRKSEKKSVLLTGPYVVWMAIFVIVPLFIMAYYGFTTKDGHFTWKNVAGIVEPVHLKALWTSFRLSVICTFLCFVLALPLALVIRGLHIRSNGIIIFIFILPMWMNFLLRTIAWQSLLEKSGVINSVLLWLHLPEQNMINTESAIILGMVYNYLPFMVLPIYNALIKISQDTFDAAKDLGAGWWCTMRHITLPLIFPGVVSGSTMVFVPALTTFVLSDILGGGKIQLIGNVIEQEFTTANNWNLGAGLSLVLMVLVVGSMALMSKYDKSGEGGALW